MARDFADSLPIDLQSMHRCWDEFNLNQQGFGEPTLNCPQWHLSRPFPSLGWQFSELGAPCYVFLIDVRPNWTVVLVHGNHFPNPGPAIESWQEECISDAFDEILHLQHMTGIHQRRKVGVA